MKELQMWTYSTQAYRMIPVFMGVMACLVTISSLLAVWNTSIIIKNSKQNKLNLSEFKIEPCKHPENRREYTMVPLRTIASIWEKCGMCGRMISSREVERIKEDDANRGIPKLIRPAWFDLPISKV